MLTEIRNWFNLLMRNRELAVLLVTVPLMLAVLYLLLGVLSPLFVGVLFAYLLEKPVQSLERRKIPRTISVSMVISLFLLLLTLLLLIAFPRLGTQLSGLFQQLPRTGDALPGLIGKINRYLPDFIDPIDSEMIGENVTDYLAIFGKSFLETTLTSASDIFTLLVYGVLMPLLVFFLLKDKDLLLAWMRKYVPHNRVFSELYASVDEQFGAYIRGKVIEGGIIGALSLAAFSYYELEYALVLAVLVGLSVIIPFIGAIIVTFPVLAVAYLQFGGSEGFVYVMIAYLLIQIFDGQLLVPLLFSEVVKIHPVGILIAIVFFGNLWGIWGVFFAIPLASLIKSFLVVVEKHRHVTNVP